MIDEIAQHVAIKHINVITAKGNQIREQFNNLFFYTN